MTRLNWDKVDDTYAEAFSGIFCRTLVTADDEETSHEPPTTHITPRRSIQVEGSSLELVKAHT